MSEIEELRLAYAECSRQKNELLTAHKLSAQESRVLREALCVLLDFAGTVAGGASWWDAVWAEQSQKLDALEKLK